MRILFVFLAAAFIVGAVGEVHAIEAVSANGFTCTQQPVKGNRSLVECTGQFQGVTGLFAATGYDLVHVEYTPDNKKRYFYMSETGCLILNASNNAALATSRSGTKKQFTTFMDAMNWCYSGGKTTGTPQ